MEKRRMKGFTLVELIIVIAVIGVLAAILIPVFANVIDKANESSARSDARNSLSQFLIEKHDPDSSFRHVDSIVIIAKKAKKYYVYGWNQNSTDTGLLAANNNDNKGYDCADMNELVAELNATTNELLLGNIEVIAAANEHREPNYSLFGESAQGTPHAFSLVNNRSISLTPLDSESVYTEEPTTRSVDIPNYRDLSTALETPIEDTSIFWGSIIVNPNKENPDMSEEPIRVYYYENESYSDGAGITSLPTTGIVADDGSYTIPEDGLTWTNRDLKCIGYVSGDGNGYDSGSTIENITRSLVLSPVFDVDWVTLRFYGTGFLTELDPGGYASDQRCVQYPVTDPEVEGYDGRFDPESSEYIEGLIPEDTHIEFRRVKRSDIRSIVFAMQAHSTGDEFYRLLGWGRDGDENMYNSDYAGDMTFGTEEIIEFYTIANDQTHMAYFNYDGFEFSFGHYESTVVVLPSVANIGEFYYNHTGGGSHDFEPHTGETLMWRYSIDGQLYAPGSTVLTPYSDCTFTAVWTTP